MSWISFGLGLVVGFLAFAAIRFVRSHGVRRYRLRATDDEPFTSVVPSAATDFLSDIVSLKGQVAALQVEVERLKGGQAAATEPALRESSAVPEVTRPVAKAKPVVPTIPTFAKTPPAFAPVGNSGGSTQGVVFPTVTGNAAGMPPVPPPANTMPGGIYPPQGVVFPTTNVPAPFANGPQGLPSEQQIQPPPFLGGKSPLPKPPKPSYAKVGVEGKAPSVLTEPKEDSPGDDAGGSDRGGNASSGGPLSHDDGSVSPRSNTIDSAYFSITAPSRMAVGGTYVVDVWAHLEGQIDEIIERARRITTAAKAVGTKGPVQIARGTLASIKLEIGDLVIAEPEDGILWKGKISNAMFPVSVPKHATFGPRRGVARVRVRGLEIARVEFVIHVGKESNTTGRLPAKQFQHQTAFASYSSDDRDRVLARVQGIRTAIPSVDIFLDVMSLRAGDDWQERIREEVVSRDVFYLFWSRAASESRWVDWEWRCAVEERGLSTIVPVPIERSPPRPDPPKELSALHFDEPILRFMSDEERALDG